MPKTVQARLDDESHDLLKRLRRNTGLTDSALLRRGLRMLAQTARSGTPRILGLGKFASRHHDLGSSKKHLRDFGHS